DDVGHLVEQTLRLRPGEPVHHELICALKFAHPLERLGAKNAVDLQRRAAPDLVIERILQRPHVLAGHSLAKRSCHGVLLSISTITIVKISQPKKSHSPNA